MTIDEKIELYFFDPSKSRDEYIDYYKSLNSDRFTREKGYRYSPIFIICKDIHYCFGWGKEFNPCRKELHPADFAGVLLLNIGYDTVRKIYGKGWTVFAEDYMGIKDSDKLEALRDLRDALTHRGYSLSTYRKKTGEKVYFSLGYHNEIIEERTDWEKSYHSKMYKVNPYKLWTALEKGIVNFKNDLLNNSNVVMRKKFDKAFDIDRWILVAPI